MKQFLRTAKGRMIMICAAILVIVIVIVILLTLLLGGETSYRSISISEISGKVIAANSSSSYEAYENMVLGNGYSLTTNTESYTRMLLDSDKYMKLEEQSCARFESLGSPTDHRTAIRLDYGALSTEITAPLKDDEDFVVNTPNAVLAVRGTFFRVEVSFDVNGDAYTDVYTYGGAVACRRVMPDGTVVYEDVVVNKGYKARIKMDEIITIYVEELIEESSDNVDPLEMNDIHNGQLVDVYNASAHGHEMFRSTKELWNEIAERKIDIKDYASAYDGEEIPPYIEENMDSEETTTESFVTTAPGTMSEAFETSVSETAEGADLLDNDETRQPESSLLSETGEAEPQITETSVLAAEVTAPQTSFDLPSGTDPAAASTGTAVTTGFSGSVSRPAETTTAPRETTTTAPTETTETTGRTDETEESSRTTTAAETTTTTWVNTATSVEIVTRPKPFTTPATTTPEATTASTEPSHVHTFIEETVAASCTGVGYTRTKCSVCGAVISETVIPATGHNTGSVTVAAGCETEGEQLDICKTCGIIVSQTVIPATGHIVDTTTVGATCETDGEKTEKCRTCGKVLSQTVIPATGHIVDTTTFEATCETDGEKTEKCRICGTIVSQTVIPATGHSYEVTETKPASCTEEGVEAEVCTVCGQEKPDSQTVLPKLPHTEETVSDGSVETVKCSVCGEVFSEALLINEVNFPDAVFRQYVSDNFDPDGSGTLTDEERGAVTEIDVQSKGVTSLKGVEHFTKLEILNCCYNSGLTELDVSKNTALTDLRCFSTKIKVLDVSKNISLTYLNCNYCRTLGTLDVSQNTALTYLNCGKTQISRLDISKNIALVTLYCSKTKIPYIDISNCPLISTFDVSRNTHPITVTDGTFDMTTIPGFDPNRVSNLTGGTLDTTTGIISGITAGTNITYTYDCDGRGGHNETFTLAPDENSTFAPTGVAIDEVNFPDEVFRQYVTTNFDKDSDEKLTEAECEGVTEIDISGSVNEKGDNIERDGGVKSFKGIEYFENLTSLKCSCNGGLKELDVSKNTALIYLDCSWCDFASLDVSDNTALTHLDCGANFITSLDVGNNTVLTYLDCNWNNIASLDVSKNTALTYLDCSRPARGKITTLDLSKNAELTYLDCSGNSIMNALDVSQNTALTFLNCGGTEINTLNVSNNTALKDLYCCNTQISALDVRSNTALTELDCHSTQISTLDVSKNTALTHLECYSTPISTLDVSQNTALQTLDCSGTKISTLDVSKNTELTSLNCGRTEISTLDVSQNTALTHLECYSTPISTLDVSQNTALQTLDCSGAKISTLDVNNNTALDTLICVETQISTLDVSNNTALTYLSCSVTQISELDVSNNTALRILYCSHTQIPYIDVSNCTALSNFSVGNCTHPITVVNGTFDTKNIPGFNPSRVSNLTGGTLDSATGIISGITEGTNITYTYDCNGVGGHNETFTLAPDENSTFAPAGVAIDSTNFPDEKFRQYVSDNFDTDKNGTLTSAECEAVTEINVGGTYYVDGGITSLKGIEHFVKLTRLYCYYNRGLRELDVSQNTVLTDLQCCNTLISMLDVNNNTALIYLNCFDTQISALDISQNMELIQLMCYNTPISTLDVSNNTALTTLWCYNTQIPYIDVSNCSSISTFEVYSNTHPITVVGGTFDTKTIPGFNPSRVSNLTGGTLDTATGVISGITEGTNITYTYDCDGAGGHNETFTLAPDESSTFAPAGVAIDSTNFPDAKFREYVSTNFDKDSNGTLTEEECEAVAEIDVSGTGSADGGINSLKGVEHFTKLTRLYCSYNSGLTELDVSQNTALIYLYFFNTQISTLDVSKNTALQVLTCYNTPISTLDVSNNTALTHLTCYNTQISTLDVSKNTALSWLNCSNTQISALDVSQNTALQQLNCHDTQISELDVSKNTALTNLQCNYTQISTLDVSKNTALTDLQCCGTPISTLDVSNNTALRTLYCYNTQVSTLDVSQNTSLKSLLCYNTQIPYIDISNCSSISIFGAYGCTHPITVNGGTFNTNTIPGFDTSRVSNLTGGTWDPATGIISGIMTGTNITYTYDCDGKGGRDWTFTLVPGN